MGHESAKFGDGKRTTQALRLEYSNVHIILQVFTAEPCIIPLFSLLFCRAAFNFCVAYLSVLGHKLWPGVGYLIA